MKRFDKMILRRSTAVVLAATFAIPATVIAQTKPVTLPVVETPAHITGTVTAVRGNVRYRNSPDQPWAICKVGATVSEGAEFQTSLRSNVQLLLPPQQVITLDRCGSMTLLEAIKQNGKYTTDVGMKHGRVRYDFAAPGVEHETTVSTPNGTLAVRDTELAIQDERPFSPEAFCLSGTVEYTSAKRTLSIGNNTNRPVKAVGDQDPANTSLSEAVVDPSIQLARTPSEQPLVANLLSRGAVFSTQTTKVIPIVSGGTPPTDDQLQKTLPGKLDFVLRWDSNVNLDIAIVGLTKGETLYPATGLNNSRSGGIIPFNDVGGPHGGIELGYWNKSYPKGYYEVDVNDLSAAPANFTLDVFEKGQLDPIFSSTSAGSTGVTTLTGTVQGKNSVGSLVQVGGGGSTVPPTGGGNSDTPPTNAVHTVSRNASATIRPRR